MHTYAISDDGQRASGLFVYNIQLVFTTDSRTERLCVYWQHLSVITGLALSMYNMKEAYLLHIATPASVWLKFSLSTMFTLLPPPNLDCHLHMLAISLCSNTAEFTSIIIIRVCNLCSIVFCDEFTVAKTTNSSHEWKTCWLPEMERKAGVINKQALEDRFQNASRDSCGISLRHKYITV